MASTLRPFVRGAFYALPVAALVVADAHPGFVLYGILVTAAMLVLDAIHDVSSSK